MAKKLVIVESPSKAKTIEKILGKGYEVTASYGHVIDLPKTKIGIDIENNFEPKYQVIKGKSEVLKKLKEKSKTASAVYLASDQDREGEAIAWHISNYIKQPNKTKRIEFNEITKTAVNNAIKNPRNINENLVNDILYSDYPNDATLKSKEYAQILYVTKLVCNLVKPLDEKCIDKGRELIKNYGFDTKYFNQLFCWFFVILSL